MGLNLSALRMEITYDHVANASYIYFTPLTIGGVAKTFTYQELTVDLDEDSQIVAMRLSESNECAFRDRLGYALMHSEVSYDSAGQRLDIVFTQEPVIKHNINWDANIDLDINGQIVGVEILFADPGFTPNDGIERLYVAGKLAHVSKYIVPFDNLH